jgi:uncharacterized C2H2 Zn-finger protein
VTTGCANCESLKLAVIGANDAEILLLCSRCRAVVKVVLEEFVPGFSS